MYSSKKQKYELASPQPKMRLAKKKEKKKESNDDLIKNRLHKFYPDMWKIYPSQQGKINALIFLFQKEFQYHLKKISLWELVYNDCFPHSNTFE